ncbi:MAG: phosphoglycerate dehydrogenase [Merdibacter sp.]|nr:phosphoglycerate dehydrogenase [Merdibacter sp.]
MQKILITPRGYAKFGKEYRSKLEQAGYEVDWNDTGKPLSRETFVEKAKQSVGIIVGVESCDRELLTQCKHLKAIVKFGIGVDNIDLKACEELGIGVGRCVGTNSNAVAEMTVALMFACARDLVSTAMRVKQGEWIKPTGIELKDKKIGILGFGNIGKNVARMAYGIGMSVYAYDIYDIAKEELDKYGAKQRSVEEIIKECDFITIHTPLTDATKNMISTEEFKKMKSGCIVINTARGGIVDEKALLEALKNKEIAAAASDVFTSEPPVGEDWVKELLSLDNFVLTAHIASRSKEAEMNTVKRSTEVILELLQKGKDDE